MNENQLISLAIKEALNSNWQKAAAYNLAILKAEPEDLEALLRLAKAYEELGKENLSKRTYNRVIKIDKFNPIAKRNLTKLRDYKISKKDKNQTSKKIAADLFLEEPGKTKTVCLVRLAPAKVLLGLDIAEEVKLAPGKRSIAVRDRQNVYLGRLPDDLSQRLIKLILGGSQYLAVVKAVDKQTCQIFIKEVKTSKKNSGIPSFPSPQEQYLSFLPKGIIKE